MARSCKHLMDLCSQGYWDDVFRCLDIDGNSTIELANLKIPGQHYDMRLNDHKASLNFLHFILAFILFLDQIFYIILWLYLLLFVVKFVRLRGLRVLQKWASKLKFALRIKKGNKGEKLMMDKLK